MESINKWLEIFIRSWECNNKIALTRILKDAPGYLRHIPENEKEMVLESIFDKRKGLLKFMEAALCMQESQIKLFSNALTESFKILQLLIELFVQEYEPYIIQTRNICFLSIKTNLFNIQMEASRTLKKLVESFKNYNMEIIEIVKQCKTNSALYIVVGAVAKCSPKMFIDDKNLVNSIFLDLLYELQHQYTLIARQKQKENIKIYLQCLLDMLVNFVPFESTDSFYLNRLYQYLSSSELTESREIKNITISLLTTHIQYFSSFIIEDYKKWHSLLNIMNEEKFMYNIDGLKKFYNVIELYLLKEDKKDLFLYFKNWFETNLMKKYLLPDTMAVIINGLGQFTSLYAKYSPMEINRLFQIISHRSLSLSINVESTNQDIELLPDYLQTLSKFFNNIPSVTLHDLNIIIKLSILIIKKFPELKNQTGAIDALKTTFSSVKQLETDFQQGYFLIFFNEGILWTCSHALDIDIELEQKIENLPNYPTCYKNYMPIWQLIFKMEEEKLALQIFNYFVSVIMLIINMLNINIKSQRSICLSDVPLLMTMENETDFRYYINLVDLCIKLFEDIDLILLQKWIERLLTYFIECSNKHPLISGFYKLIKVIFKRLSGIESNCEVYFNTLTCESISQYLRSVLNQVSKFHGELQISCIYLIFNTPLPFVLNIIDETQEIFKIAFKIGLMDLPLAFCTLETLKKWCNSFKNENLNEFYQDIILCVQPYFENKENDLELYDIITYNSKEKINPEDKSLKVLQKQILLFYGSLSHNVSFNFGLAKSLEIYELWNEKNLLPVQLVFPDVRLDIILEQFILKMINLIKTGDRRKKYSACELLHTIITMVLGKKLTDLCFNKNFYYVILNLGCDLDDAIRSLYHPLIMQLTHYLSDIKSRMTETFIDALFEGLADEFTPSLRDYCSVCLEEFGQWVIKQSQKSNYTDFSNLVRKIIYFASYPSNNKRVAAAIAFKNLYPVFKNNICVEDKWWIEFLYTFVISLEECNDIRIISILSKIEKVIKQTEKKTLNSTVIWLLNQCGSLNALCRITCMKLFENLCVQADEYKSVQEFLNSYSIESFNEIALKNLDENLDCITTYNTKVFSRALDLYTWVINKKILLPEFILINASGHEEKNIFFKFFSNFVSCIVNQNLEKTIAASTNTAKEADELINLIRESIIKIFGFLRTLLLAKGNNTNNSNSVILENLWSDDFYSLIFRFTLCPRRIGFTSKSLQAIDSRFFIDLFITMINKLPEAYLIKMRDDFFIEKHEEFENFINNLGITNVKDDIAARKDFVRGITILRKCKFFDVQKEYTFAFFCACLKDKIHTVYQAFLVHNSDDETGTYFTDYLEDVMHFILLQYQPVLIETLIELFVMDFSSNQLNFFKTFKTQIYDCMLIKPSETLKIMYQNLRDTPNEMYLLIIIEHLITYVEQYNINGVDIANEVIKNCHFYKNLTADVKKIKDRFFNINRIAVSLASKSIDLLPDTDSLRDLYLWISEEFTKAENFDKKSAIIESFLICMANESNKINPNLLFVFENLVVESSTVRLENLKTNQLQRFQEAHCLRILLKMLAVMKSSLLLEGIIKYAMGFCELFETHVNEELKAYFMVISADDALKSLELIYKMFKDLDSSPQERFDTLQYFLLPSLEVCELTCIEKFYAIIFHELPVLVVQELPEAAVVNERKQILINEIGGYRLLELMFGKIQSNKINAFIQDDKFILDHFLINQTDKVRCYSAKFEEEKELARQLHCAALNCCIAMISSGDVEHYSTIFKETRAKNQLIWEKIVDCDRIFDLVGMPNGFRKKTISIRWKIEDVKATLEPSYVSYFRRLDSTETSFPKSNNRIDQRMCLNLENDDLNNQECSAMITGAIMHFFNSNVTLLPSVGEELQEESVPKWLLHFVEAFKTDQDNVILYLFRIISNTKAAFLPYLRLFFVSLANAICAYLSRNNLSLNYLVRDMLMLIVEAKFELRKDEEVDAAQKLVENLIEQAPVDNHVIYDYNVDTIENLLILWNQKLKIPKNLNSYMDSNPELAIRIILLLFRHRVECKNLITNRQLHAIIRKAIFRWQEPETPYAYETLGWIMRLIRAEQRDLLIEEDLVDIFPDMQRYDCNYCTRIFYLTVLGCPSLAKREELFKFADSRAVDNNERKAECYEIFLISITDHEPNAVCASLDRIDLIDALRDRVLPCVKIGFRIIDKLVKILDAKSLLPYVQVIEAYADANALLEHKTMAYDVFLDVYKRYANTANDSDEDLKALFNLAKKNLILGIADPYDEIQDNILDFWNKQAGLPESLTCRLIHLLQLFDLGVHSSYAQFLCLTMLDLATKTPNTETVLFDPLCSYEDYEIQAPRTWRRRKRVSLYVPSLAALLERAIFQQGSRIKKPASTNEELEKPLAASVIARFEILDHLTGSSEKVTNKIPDPSESKLSKRFLSRKTSTQQTSDVSFTTDEYCHKLKAEAAKQRDTVRINRKYRIGDYPDVEITQSTLIATLADLVRRDQSFAADLSVTLVSALVKSLDGTEMCYKLLDVLAETCDRAISDPNDFAPSALEILYHSGCKKFDVDRMTKIANIMGLQSLAILLLERESTRLNESIFESPAQKKLARVISPLPNRLQLASLYQALEESDVVLSIFKNWTLPTYSADLQKGQLAELKGNWIEGKKAYEKAYDVEAGFAKDYCTQGIFRCLSELSSWSEINKKIDIILNKDYNSIWQNSNKNELLPWIFTSQLQKELQDLSLGKSSETAFIELADNWVYEKGSIITKSFGDITSLLHLCSGQSSERSSHLRIRSCLEHLRNQWISDRSNDTQKYQILERLRGINDINAYLEAVQSKDLTTGTTDLMNYWQRNSSESAADNLLVWNKRVNCRLGLMCTLIEKLKDASSDSSILSYVMLISLKQRLNISKLALQHRNYIVAYNHILQIRKNLDKLDDADTVNFINCQFQCAEAQNQPENKFSLYEKSWHLADKIIQNEAIDHSLRIQTKLYAFDLTSALHNLIQNDGKCVTQLINNEFMCKALNVAAPEQLEEALFDFRFNLLKSACQGQNDKYIAKSYIKFAEYCHELMTENYDQELVLQEEFISSVLNGMRCGSTEAIRYFPCLLKTSFYKSNEKTTQLFLKISQKVPSWMFLSWQEQLMSQLVTPLVCFVLPIIHRLAKDYPNAVMYSFKTICENHPKLKSDPVIDNLSKLLFPNPRIKTFFQAINYLCQPEHYLKWNLLKIIRLVDNNENFVKAVDSLLCKLFENSDCDENLQGPIWESTLHKYREKLEELKIFENRAAAKRHIQKICNNLEDNALGKNSSTSSKIEKSGYLQLQQYSPYINNCLAEDVMIEVPGQYSGLSKPLPHYHAMISKIDPVIQVDSSKSSSIKIGIIATNAKTYKFLIKSGVDIRRDHRMQQIFDIANKTLRNDRDCNKRRACVNTYNIVSLSESLSLIEWINGARSLKEMLKLSASKKYILQVLPKKYEGWIHAATDEVEVRESNKYKRALLKYSAKDVTVKMKEFTESIEWDLLRKTFVQISPSADYFFRTRQNFITSYATMCMVHWIAGIGDRNLENILVDINTGNCFGIKFDMVFGAGVYQPVPELVPFRLTTQILGLLRPFREQDLFGATMVRTLSTLKLEKRLILACLDVFLNEKLDYHEKLNELLQADDPKCKVIKWLPKKKFAIVKKKLNGAKPSNILVEELSYMYKDDNDDDNDENQYFALYKHIISGNMLHHPTIRSSIKNDDLSPELQVKCLLDQAADVNILGRMWVKWSSFT